MIYSYTFNKSDIYTGKCASIDEALAEARQEAELYPDGDKPQLVYIGRYKPFKPVIEAEWVLEVLQRDAYDVSDAAEGWLDNLTPAEVELLGERLTRVFRRWFQYRKRYEVTCDPANQVPRRQVPHVSIPQAV